MLAVSVGKLPHIIDSVMKNTFHVAPVIENNSKATEINQYLDFFTPLIFLLFNYCFLLVLFISQFGDTSRCAATDAASKAAFMVTRAHEIDVWNTSLHLFLDLILKPHLPSILILKKLRGIWETVTPTPKRQKEPTAY